MLDIGYLTPRHTKKKKLILKEKPFGSVSEKEWGQGIDVGFEVELAKSETDKNKAIVYNAL